MLLYRLQKYQCHWRSHPTLTQDSDHVAEQDIDDDEDQRQVMVDVHESIAAGRTKEIHVCLVGSLQI